jgi:hypothetical protein
MSDTVLTIHAVVKGDSWASLRAMEDLLNASDEVLTWVMPGNPDGIEKFMRETLPVLEEKERRIATAREAMSMVSFDCTMDDESERESCE